MIENAIVIGAALSIAFGGGLVGGIVALRLWRPPTVRWPKRPR